MANTKKNFTMQGVGSPVSAAGQGEKAGPQASSSCDRSSVEVGTMASTEYKATRHVHDEQSKLDTFCYVCGSYVTPNIRKTISQVVRDAYQYCFNSDIVDQNEDWVPHRICANCYKTLTSCYKFKNISDLKFSSPVIWNRPESREDCFFCMTKTKGYNFKNRSEIKYVYTSKVAPAVLKQIYSNCPKNVVTNACGEEETADTDVMDVSDEALDKFSEMELTADDGDSSTTDDENEKTSTEPQKFSQAELSDLGLELGLSKEAHELLASRLKQKNLLEKGANITLYRNREQELRKFFSQDKTLNLVYCNDIAGLINSLKAGVYKPEEWRLFIDSSVRSLKAILLHITNVLAPIPIAHSTVLKESYENVKILLEKIRYSNHKWRICGDLKIIGIILGMQSGNIKYPCFLCLFDSRDRVHHYVQKIWPERKCLEPGSWNVLKPPLVDATKILIPPLHLKLGLMKQFVKALDKSGKCFQYIAQKMRKLSDAKLQAGIFDGPAIRQLFNDVSFTDHMTDVERAAWTSFRKVSQNFLGNNKSPHYEELVKDMIRNYQVLGCNMSIKIHFLDSHIEFFPDRLGDFSEEQGERCHQDMKDMEKRYQGVWGVNMMADYCWNLKRDVTIDEKKRKRRSLRRSFEDKQVRYHKRSKDE